MNNRKRKVDRVEMNKKAEKLEQLIEAYLKEPGQENFEALVSTMHSSSFLLPAMLPNTPEIQAMKKAAKENPGQQVKLPEGVVPIPSIVRNKEGITCVPIYTSSDQIPAEPKHDMVMRMPFKSCSTLALDPNIGASGILINPFSKSIFLKKELLEAIQKAEVPNPQGAKQIKVSQKQYRIMMRQRAEFINFPAMVFSQGEEFMNMLSNEKETIVNRIYQRTFQEPSLYPYSESDFSVLPLNIQEDLMLIRVDLPAIKEKAQMCYRVYITWQSETKQPHYFTIECGKEKGERNLGGIDADGKHLEYGEAPVEGAEIQRILDIIEQEKKQTS